MFFQKNGQRLNCFCHVYSFGLCQTHLQYTKTHGILGDQIAYTVGHGAPGTFELMNYHLLHVKCHCRFMPLEQGEFSISATTPSLIFSQWHGDDVSQPQSIINENENPLLPRIPLCLMATSSQIYISPVCLPFLTKCTDTDTDNHTSMSWPPFWGNECSIKHPDQDWSF